jgi:hypothetical protein
MQTRPVVLGAAVLLLLLTPLRATAQEWSVHGEFATDYQFRLQTGAGKDTRTFKLNNTEGVMLSIGTPYHVGFGLGTFKGDAEPEKGFHLKLETVTANVYVDVPVPWVKFHVGAGWGKLSFSPDKVPDSNGNSSSTLKDINLWEWFARLGIPLPWSLHLLIGYHEYHGRFAQLHGDNRLESVDTTTSISTLGLGYTF